MFESLSLSDLQNYWWFIICVIGALFVFLMFVQGGQTLVWSLGKTENEKTMIYNILGRKWELGFTTLVLFGGALFASFPKFYATSFGGAYFFWMLVLFSFILQAVSYEYRKKQNNVFGAKTFESFLFLNGILGPLLVGGAVATFFSGSPFLINSFNLGTWQSSWRGLEALASVFNLSLGLTVLFLVRIMGAQYLINQIESEDLILRARRSIYRDFFFFLPFFVGFIMALFLRKGFSVDPLTGEVSLLTGKYFWNLIELHIIGIVPFLLGTILVLISIFRSIFKDSDKGIWYGGLGTVLVVFSLFSISGFNHTAFYPSSHDLQSSLTIQNASSSHYTLSVMSYVSLLVPFVIAYIIYVWTLMSSTKMTEEEVENSHHLY